MLCSGISSGVVFVALICQLSAWRMNSASYALMTPETHVRPPILLTCKIGSRIALEVTQGLVGIAMILRTSLPVLDRTIYWLMSRACLDLQTDKIGILDVRLQGLGLNVRYMKGWQKLQLLGFKGG